MGTKEAPTYATILLATWRKTFTKNYHSCGLWGEEAAELLIKIPIGNDFLMIVLILWSYSDMDKLTIFYEILHELIFIIKHKYPFWLC
jgi:transcriptional regulator